LIYLSGHQDAPRRSLSSPELDIWFYSCERSTLCYNLYPSLIYVVTRSINSINESWRVYGLRIQARIPLYSGKTDNEYNLQQYRKKKMNITKNVLEYAIELISIKKKFSGGVGSTIIYFIPKQH